jgi:hypothetical protein
VTKPDIFSKRIIVGLLCVIGYGFCPRIYAESGIPTVSIEGETERSGLNNGDARSNVTSKDAVTVDILIKRIHRRDTNILEDEEIWRDAGLLVQAGDPKALSALLDLMVDYSNAHRIWLEKVEASMKEEYSKNHQRIHVLLEIPGPLERGNLVRQWLMKLTGQDFGEDFVKWRQYWNANKDGFVMEGAR